MNARERVLAAITHNQPDRVPIDLGATPSSGISAIAYNHLKRHLGISTPTRVYDVVQQLAQPDDAFVRRFNIDILDVGRAFNAREEEWYDIALADGSTAQYPKWFRPERQADGSWSAFKNGVMIARMPSGATFFDQNVFPYVDGYPADFSGLPEAMSQVLWSGLAHSPWDNAGTPDFWERLRAECLALRKTSGRALMIVCGCNLFEWGTFLRRIDNFLMDLLTDPDTVERLLDALMEQHLKTLEKVCATVGDVVDIIRFGDDLGMDNGPFMDPSVYRSLFKPHHKILCDYVKKHSGMHTFLHSCGSIYQLLPDLIEAGYDIINPVQTNCRDMDPVRLKREFGKDICFWGGGIDTRSVLNGASIAAIKDQVKRRMEIFAPGGGFVFNPVHNILPDVPPENILAMFEAVEEFNGTGVGGLV